MPDTILRTRFIPPRLQKDEWIKGGLKKQMSRVKEYPLTMISAGPGCGKTTLLASYFKNYDNYAWYTLNEFDDDPGVFIQNLISAVNYSRRDLGSKSLEHLKNEGEDPGQFMPVLDIFLNELLQGLKEDYYLVLDDIHHIYDSNVVSLLNYFITHLPPGFHVILAGRYQPEFPGILNWQLKNRVHIIDNEDFSLEQEEVKDFLFQRHDINVEDKKLKKIYDLTEGWIMALDLLGRRLSGNEVDRDSLKTHKDASLQILFEYLTKEVMEEISEKKRDFLFRTSILEEIEEEICQRWSEDGFEAEKFLEEMAGKSLFVKKYGSDQYRYHQMFRDFLQKRAEEKFSIKDIHSRAALLMEKMGRLQRAVHHYLKSESYSAAAEQIMSIAGDMLERGKIEVLQDFLEELPADIYDENPRLYLYEGDIYRAKNDFNGALALYEEARQIMEGEEAGEGASEAAENLRLEVLKRMALVYLDTVQPARADEYLQEVEKLRRQQSGWQEAELLRLLAENKINEGEFEEAENYRREAEKISQNFRKDFNLTSRVQLRTGRLHKALSTLEEKENMEGSSQSMPRSHRETVLLRSLINSFLGREKQALNAAQKGLSLAENFPSPFTEAVAHMRIGHARQLMEDFEKEEVKASYQDAMDILEEIDLRRGKCEPLLGMSLLEAFYGDRNLGEQYAREGRVIAEKAGDEWLMGLLLSALGINRFQQNRLDRAREDFQQARQVSKKTYDVFTRAVCDYWLAIIHHQKDRSYRRQMTLYELLNLLDDNNLMQLIRMRTFLTARDPDRIVPVLLAARDEKIEMKSNMRQRLTALLGEMGYNGLDRHPGYTLRISALGRCRFKRGWEEITEDEWERKKAKKLLLLFLVHRGEMISRDKICELLWPDSNLESARRNFKVTLNSLKKTLEPEREPRQDPYFINRRNHYYGFNQDSSYYYDVEEFEKLIDSGKREKLPGEAIKHYLRAVSLYDGDFLQEEDYIDFVREERENLRHQYLTAQHRIIEHYFAKEEFDSCIEHCNEALKVDICWEKGYYYLMKCYLALNRRSMAIKTYRRCREILREKMNLSPGDEIEKLYRQLQ